MNEVKWSECVKILKSSVVQKTVRKFNYITYIQKWHYISGSKLRIFYLQSIDDSGFLLVPRSRLAEMLLDIQQFCLIL